MADLDAGATGTMPSALLPDLIKPVVTHFRAGRRAEAAAAYAADPAADQLREPPVRAARDQDGDDGRRRDRSDAVRHPLEALHPATRAGLLELARDAAPLALRWGR